MRKIIDIHSLDFHYKSQEKLISGLDLQFKSGNIYGLLGKDGEGKSTILRIISGLLFPKNGKIEVFGYEPRLRQPKMLQDIFYLPEDIIGPSISIETFERIYAPFYPDFSSSTFYKYMNDFNIDSKMENIAELTYGQKKKFFIAFGLSTNVKLILLDEPTTGLDMPSKKQIRNIVSSSINDENCILISTNQAIDLEDILNQIIIMDNHEVIFNEKSEDIMKKLIFRLSTVNVSDKSVIYSEETLNGFCLLCQNTTGEVSKMDVELLFNAIMSEKNIIQSILNQQ
jgi:ABC-2 type transport system ATP-binding protein